jgi:hypothetical protein
MERARAIRAVVLVAALSSLVAPGALAGNEPAPLGVDAAASAILKSGYGLERLRIDVNTVRVNVLRRGEVLASATGKIGEPPRTVEGRVLEGEPAYPERPVVARGTAVSTP